MPLEAAAAAAAAPKISQGAWSLMGTGAGVSGGLIASHFNRKFQRRENERNREYNDQMYQRTLNDERENVRQANEYNSPQQQMQRLKEAGLNPNLVYGNGATATGGQASTPKAPTSTSTAPRMNENLASDSVALFASLMAKQVQTDNYRAQRDLIDEQAEAARLNNSFKRDTYQADVDKHYWYSENSAQQVELRKVETQLKWNEDARRELTTTRNLSYTLEKILTEQSRRTNDVKQRAYLDELIKVTQNKAAIQEMEKELAKMNMSKSDPIYLRFILKFLNNYQP